VCLKPYLWTVTVVYVSVSKFARSEILFSAKLFVKLSRNTRNSAVPNLPRILERRYFACLGNLTKGWTKTQNFTWTKKLGITENGEGLRKTKS